MDYYLTKPTKTDGLLWTMKEHLDKQKREKEYGQQKLAQFVETRFKEVQTDGCCQVYDLGFVRVTGRRLLSSFR